MQDENRTPRNRSRWGLKSEKQLYTMAFRPHRQLCSLAKQKMPLPQNQWVGFLVE